MEITILTDEQKSLIDEKAAEILANENRSKMYGVEGLEVGDQFTLTPDAKGKLVLGGTYGSKDFLRFACKGDRATISASALLGPSKPRKYFGENAKVEEKELFEDWDFNKVLAECWKPETRDEKEIIPYIVANFVGAKFTCIAACTYKADFDNSGQMQDAHYYLFKCEMPTK